MVPQIATATATLRPRPRSAAKVMRSSSPDPDQSIAEDSRGNLRTGANRSLPVFTRPMAEGDTRTAGAARTAFGQGFLMDAWYFADLGASLKTGDMRRYEILGEPVLVGRTRAGKVFAMRDICPHRASPLSAGRIVPSPAGEVVECPYHGWSFRPDGACAAIPSLVADQAMDVERIRVRTY